MKLNDVLSGLAKLSPVIGGVLGGPVGGVIGKGVAVAAGMITGKDDPDDIIKSLSMDADKLAALEQKAQELELEELRIHAADRDSARSMQADLAKSGHGSAWAAPVVSVVVTIGFFIVLSMVLDGGIESVPNVALIMLGSLASGFTQVLNYWLGSSKSSNDKTQMLVKR